jgi:hypothetical protein
MYDNYFENNWVDAQQGFAFVEFVDNFDFITEANNDDIYIGRNIWVNSPRGFNLSPNPIVGGNPQTRFLISDNLFIDIGYEQGSVAFAWRFFNDMRDLTYAYNLNYYTNTTLPNSGWLQMSRVADRPARRLTVHGNIGWHGGYGVTTIDMSPGGTGQIGLGLTATEWQGQDNVLVGAPLTNYETAFYRPPSITDANFINPSGNNYELIDGTPYTHSGAKVGILHEHF